MFARCTTIHPGNGSRRMRILPGSTIQSLPVGSFAYSPIALPLSFNSGNFICDMTNNSAISLNFITNDV